MRIAIVKRRCSLRVGGSERYCVSLAREFLNRGHDVTVVGQSIDDDLRTEIPFVPIPIASWSSSAKNRSFAKNVALAVAPRDFDIVYGLGRAYGLDAVRVTERLQSHWVRVRYGRQWEQRLQLLNPRHRTLIHLENTIYRSPSVRRVVTQSSLDRQLVSEYYGVPDERLRVIHNGVDTQLFRPPERCDVSALRNEIEITDDQPLLLFASMDFEGKGLRTIIRALQRLGRRDAILAVLGTGPIERFRKLCERHGVAEQVRFLGRRSDIARFYGAADLFLLPTAYEPFPNVNLEAMACGTPVLTTATAGGIDLVQQHHNGYLIPHMNAECELIETLDVYLSLGSEAREAMRTACLETARAMPLERNVEQTLSLFEEVLDDKRAA